MGVKKMEETKISRRDFLKMAATGSAAAIGAAAGASLGVGKEREEQYVPPMEKMKALFKEIEGQTLNVEQMLTALRTGNGLPDAFVVTFDEPISGRKGQKALFFRLTDESVVPTGPTGALSYTTDKAFGNWNLDEAFVHSANLPPSDGAFYKGTHTGTGYNYDRQLIYFTSAFYEFPGVIDSVAKQMGVYMGNLG